MIHWRTLLIAALGFAGAVAQVSAADADWRGTYKPISEECKPNSVRLGKNAIWFGAVRNPIAEVLVNNENEYAVTVAATAGAGWSGTVIALTKGRGSNAGGVDFYQYQAVDQWRVGNEQRYCAYASRQ